MVHEEKRQFDELTNSTGHQRTEGKKTMKSNRNKTRDIVLIALFAVLMAVCAWIAIPTAIPFTMQTFAVFFTLNFLGGKKGTASVCIYLLLGLIGLPVYANFTSGIGILMGTTGGYMVGWIFSGLVMWLLEKLIGRKLWAQAVSMLIGLTVCYIAGTAWFMVVYAQNVGPIGLWTALLWCVVPFIIPDLVKLALALWLSLRLKKITRSL